MPDVYGSFLRKDSPHFSEYYPKFLARVASLEVIAAETLRQLESDFPNLVGAIKVSYANLTIALGRYFNDVIAIKTNHRIDTLHLSKVAAYSIKWIRYNPVLVCVAAKADLAKLSEDERLIALNANFYLIAQVLNYYLQWNASTLPADKRDSLLTDLRYLLDTAQYSEKSTAILFHSLSWGLEDSNSDA